jgi:hypothetical protein
VVTPPKDSKFFLYSFMTALVGCTTVGIALAGFNESA